MSPVVTALYRYPVKGFSPEPLAAAALAAGETLAYDRAFAVENGPSGFDPAAPCHLPKMKFFCLMKNASLAAVVTRFQETGERLVVTKRDGSPLFDDSLATDTGREAFAAFLARHFPAETRGTPKVLRAPGHSFSDVAKKVLHLINLASLRDLEAKLGHPIDPIRFRPNLVVDGLAPHSELDWAPGTRLTIGGVPFEMVKRTVRCAATTVDPASGRRDLQIPKFLMQTLGHTDCGVYLRVVEDGSIAVGDPIDL